MMVWDTLYALLLVPAAGGHLLAEGPAGYLPPVMRSGPVCGYPAHRKWTVDGHPNCYMCGDGVALVLLFEGRMVPAGFHVALAASLKATLGQADLDLEDAPPIPMGLFLWPSMDEIVSVARACVEAGYATKFIALDREGREVPNAE